MIFSVFLREFKGILWGVWGRFGGGVDFGVGADRCLGGVVWVLSVSLVVLFLSLRTLADGV